MSVPRQWAAIIALGALLGCAAPTPSGSPVATPTPGPTSPTSQPTPTLEAGPGLCAIFPPDLAVAALGGPVDEPTAGNVRGSTGIYCRYAAAGDAASNVEATVQGRPRAECEDEALFMGLRPTSGVGDVAYHRAQSEGGDNAAFVIAWASSRCVFVVVRSNLEETAMLQAADAIAARVLQPPP